jgi:uncharacterized membrane protein
MSGDKKEYQEWDELIESYKDSIKKNAKFHANDSVRQKAIYKYKEISKFKIGSWITIISIILFLLMTIIDPYEKYIPWSIILVIIFLTGVFLMFGFSFIISMFENDKNNSMNKEVKTKIEYQNYLKDWEMKHEQHKSNRSSGIKEPISSPMSYESWKNTLHRRLR